MKEINGFEIDEYNIHRIPNGATTSTCPECSESRKKKKDKCASVFWDTGLLQCNHCGERIQMHTYKKKEDNTKKVYVKPVKKDKAVLSDLAIDWFSSERHISKQTLIDLKVTEGIKWMPKAKANINTIEFNYYLFGELINTKSRGKNKDFKFEKDCELIMYNLDSIIGKDEAVLVEGEPDALSYHDCGVKNVASVPNGFTLPKADGSSSVQTAYLDDYYGVFEPIKKIYLAFDNDVAGIEGQKEFIRRLGAEKCYIVDFKDCKDANDYKIKYGGEALKQTLVDAKIVPLEGIMNISDVNDELEDFWINGAKKGMTIDIPEIDNIYSIVKKQHTLLVSAPGSGKSDLIDHIVCKMAVKYNEKIGICSTENKPEIFHYDKLVKKINGMRPTADNLKSKQVLECKEFIDENFYHVDIKGRYFLEDVLAKFSELNKRKNVKIFILDPYNKISLKNFSKSDITAYTAEYHQQIDAFDQLHDSHTFLVAHPVKLANKEGSTKTFVMPDSYKVKGGGEHFDMSYNMLGMVRDYEHNMVNIQTLKVKFQHLGVSGQDVWLGWNINNGRYTSTNNDWRPEDECEPDVTWDNSSWLKPEEKNISKLNEELKEFDFSKVRQEDDDLFFEEGEAPF